MNAKVQEALTPEVWCKRLQDTGAFVSPRTLRKQARAMGLYYSLGRTMLLHPDHIEALMAPSPPDADDQRQG